jgi:twinkle protein
MSESEYMYKTNCDACGSSDGNAVYSDGGKHCFVCNVTLKGDDNFKQSGQPMKKAKEFNPSFIEYPEQIRGISKNTLEKFTYGVTNGKHVTYYYDSEGNICAEKYRNKAKEFSWSGNSKEATMFGQNVWKPSEKIKLVITEGEIDAMSLSEVQDNKYPVISLPNGCSRVKKDVKNNYEYLSKFKEIVLMFDMDDVGQQAAIEFQAMFPPKYVKIAKLPLKDANAMLKANRIKELTQAIWNAEIHVPEEIKSGNKLVELLNKVDNTIGHPFPNFLPVLNMKSRGMRMGDLTILTGGTSSGKTTLAKQLELHFNETTDFNSGIIHLEENIRTTVEGLVSIKMGRRLHLENESHKDPEVIEAWTKLCTDKDVEGNYRYSILDAFGSVDPEKIYSMVRYLAQVDKCKIIYLDHISILVSGMLEVDERKALDKIMTDLKSLTQELDVHIFAICHLNNSTNGGKPFEEGGVPNVNNLRGSGGIKQLADNIIATTRNQMAETAEERNQVSLHLLKCRHTGDTGKADEVTFSKDTGLFTEGFDLIEPTEDQAF